MSVVDIAATCADKFADMAETCAAIAEMSDDATCKSEIAETIVVIPSVAFRSDTATDGTSCAIDVISVEAPWSDETALMITGSLGRITTSTAMSTASSARTVMVVTTAKAFSAGLHDDDDANVGDSIWNGSCVRRLLERMAK